MSTQQNDSTHEDSLRYDYQPPVSQLVALGERALRGPQPLDYRELGIAESHLAELSRLSEDPAFDPATCGDRPQRFAPVHAMRAMIQIGTEATIEPLVRLLEYDDTADYDQINDWFMDEIPQSLAKFGAAAIPRCLRLLRDASKHTHSRLAAARAIENIAEKHLAARPQCIAALAEQLERHAENEPEWNGWLVAELVEMNAVEAVPLIERAFAADTVDETIIGDWEEVQAQLGLRPPLTDEEYAAKRRNREPAHGWLRPEEELED